MATAAKPNFYYYDGDILRELTPMSSCLVFDPVRAEAALGAERVAEICQHEKADDLGDAVLIELSPVDALPAHELTQLVATQAILPVYSCADAIFAVRPQIVVSASTSAHVTVMAFLVRRGILAWTVVSQESHSMVLGVESPAEALRLANLIHEETKVATFPSFIPLNIFG